MKTIRDRINIGEVDITINTEKQNKHIRESGGYVEGRSYLLNGNEAQWLVNTYHGMGHMPIDWRGEWKNKEVITIEANMGVAINPSSGEETLTNRFTIHYSKSGTHIVPAERMK